MIMGQNAEIIDLLTEIVQLHADHSAQFQKQKSAALNAASTD